MLYKHAMLLLHVFYVSLFLSPHERGIVPREVGGASLKRSANE